jgi:enoyl-CoA hydratase
VYGGLVAPPDEACAIGLVDEVVDPESLMDRAVSIAQELASIPSTTFALTKRALVASLLERVATVDDAALIAAWHSEEVYEAIRRYLAKTVRRK